MPTYEYKCNGCGHTFDRILKISERATPCKEKCPQCNKKKVQQAINSVGIATHACIGTKRKPPEDFRSMLKGWKKFYGKSSYGTSINDF